MTPMFPITRERIRNHIHYFWWQYALLLVFAIFGWNLLYTTTHYRSPEHLKMEWYYQGGMTENTSDKVLALMAELKDEMYPEVEEMDFVTVGMDDTYGDMQLMVWIAAGQGDIYLLEKDSFTSFASEGAMLDLQPYIDNGMLNVDGMELRKGQVTDIDTKELVLRGIPADKLTGLMNLDIVPNDRVFGIVATSGNAESSVKLLNYLINTMQE